MADRNRFVIAVDGFCDENAEQLFADGVKLFPTRVFIGGVPIDPPTSNSERDRILAVSKTSENTVIPSVSGEYERFFDAVLDERDGGDLIFITPSVCYAPALAAAKNCMVRFYGSNVFVLPAFGAGAAIVPLLELAQNALSRGESAQSTFSALSFAAKNLVSGAILPNGGFASYKIMRYDNGFELDRLSRGEAKTAAIVATEVKSSGTRCVYISHAGNYGFVGKIATAIAETSPEVKIKAGFCSPATLAVTSPRAVTIGFLKG